MRIVVPVVAALIGLMVVLSLMSPPEHKQDEAQDTETASQPANPADDGSAQDRPADPGEEPADPEPEAPDAQPPVAEGSDPEAGDPQAPEAEPDSSDNFRAVFAQTNELLAIGSDDPASEFELRAQINPYRACVHEVLLTHVKQKVVEEDRYVLLHPIDLSLGENKYPTIGSYAASYIRINGTRVKLWQQDKQTGQWQGNWGVEDVSTDSVTLTLIIQGGPEEAPTDVAKITRTFSVSNASHTLRLDQDIENLTDKPLTVQWEQLAQADVHYETNDYLRGRSRQFVTGYFDNGYDPEHFSVYVDEGFISRPDLINKLKDPTDSGKWKSIWPNPKAGKVDKELAWLATENRYFVAISSAATDALAVKETGDVTSLQSLYPEITTTIYPNVQADREAADDDRLVLISFVSNELKIEPGKASKSSDLSLDLFVGPREDEIFAQAPYAALKFDKTIRYSLGGFCGFCTFQWLANLLLSFLELLHSITFDWGVAIVILVLVVRLLLHPITKRGQINMMKMGKQMAAVQPELNKLKKKYADDPRQMQQAQLQLFREKGINPAAGALGCLPMFLQMPIWIALYAMLYYAIELRHEPAFYGVFQAIAGWPFLADLSSADRFIPLFKDDGTHVLNLLFIRLDYSSINILPILMGVTFYINMKFTTPPPMNEQQATQQKIMKIMPLIFPFFLYSAPAGLTLYICASTLAGIIDSKIVRNHVKQMEESGELFKAKPRKPGGFMDRLQKAAEAKQAQMEEMKKQQQQNRGPQNYKKRKR